MFFLDQSAKLSLDLASNVATPRSRVGEEVQDDRSRGIAEVVVGDVPNVRHRLDVVPSGMTRVAGGRPILLDLLSDLIDETGLNGGSKLHGFSPMMSRNRMMNPAEIMRKLIDVKNMARSYQNGGSESTGMKGPSGHGLPIVSAMKSSRS